MRAKGLIGERRPDLPTADRRDDGDGSAPSVRVASLRLKMSLIVRAGLARPPASAVSRSAMRSDRVVIDPPLPRGGSPVRRPANSSVALSDRVVPARTVSARRDHGRVLRVVDRAADGAWSFSPRLRHHKATFDQQGCATIEAFLGSLRRTNAGNQLDSVCTSPRRHSDEGSLRHVARPAG